MPRYAAARLVRCRQCNLVFADALPSPSQLQDHYANYPESGIPSELTIRRYTDLLELFEPFRQSGRILDIGCGDGHFLEIAREHGWSVYGSEFGEGPRNRARAKGLDVRSAPFPATHDELKSFDVVTAMEVLEHVVEPKQELHAITSLVRSGGVLYLTTPNFAAVTRRLAGPAWRAIDYPEHLNLFTPSALDSMLSSTGWRKLRLWTTGISPSDIWRAMKPPSSSNAPSYDPSPSLDQRLRGGVARSPLLDLLLRSVNATLSTFGAGDTLKALYVRTSP
jgi:2-polyprenyl-3-methyl-5-hydroxy-6-metoxy-1,4-benzoquinol methylase